MFKFFRNLRYDLMEKNKIGKYLQYAFGEVILVVAGILIALQIDNWNDTRKERLKEREMLQQFALELGDDLEILDASIAYNDFVIKSCNELIRHLEGDLPYNDSLSLYFDRWVSPDVLEFNGSTYQNLTTIGPELIRNEQLRTELLKLYNFSYKKARTFNDYFRSDFHSFIAPIQLANVEAVEWGKASVPVDYEALKKNVLFINALKWSKNGHQANNREFSKLRETIMELIAKIAEELQVKRLN